MKKKICVLAVAVALCIVLIFSMVACNGGNKNELQEYKQILEKVVSNYVEKHNSEEEQGVSLSLMSASKALSYPQEVFDALEKGTDTKDATDYMESYQGMAVNGLVSILAYVESFEEIYSLEKFYGVTIYQPSYQVDNYSVPAMYINVQSKDNHKIAYVYGGGSNESIYVYDIEFIDDSTFSITMLTLAAIDGEMQNVYYLYTDTDDRFAFLYQQEGAIYGDGSKCYEVDDEDVLKECAGLVKAQFDAVDVKTIREYGNDTDYPITVEQFNAAMEKIKERLGL